MTLESGLGTGGWWYHRILLLLYYSITSHYTSLYLRQLYIQVFIKINIIEQHFKKTLNIQFYSTLGRIVKPLMQQQAFLRSAYTNLNFLFLFRNCDMPQFFPKLLPNQEKALLTKKGGST